jgi:hypothetical protein
MRYPTVLILNARYSHPNFVGFIPTFLDLDDPRLTQKGRRAGNPAASDPGVTSFPRDENGAKKAC